MQEFREASGQDDLWTTWQRERSLRKQLRSDPSAAERLTIETRAELDFLKRSLYYSPNKQAFWGLLYANRDNLVVSEYMHQVRPLLTQEFLVFMTGYIREHKPAPRNLKFLINLFQAGLEPDFTRVVEAMDAAQCSYLESRTSNPSLRRILQNHLRLLSQPASAPTQASAGSDLNGEDFPTLFGDKLELIKAAADCCRNFQSLATASAWGPDTIEMLVNGAEKLFAAGLVNDCLAITAELAGQANPTIFKHLLDPEGYLHKRVHQLLRRALPIYCLLTEPTDAHRQTLELYRSLFPGFHPDPGSLIYLDINAAIISGLQGTSRYASLELAQLAHRLRTYRPDDMVTEILSVWASTGDQLDLSILQQLVSQRKSALPHEAYTILGIIRLGQQEKRFWPDSSGGSRLLQDYLDFFAWIPSPYFLNPEIYLQLAPLAEHAQRKTAETWLKILEEDSVGVGPAASLPTHKGEASELLHKRWNLGKYLGVY